MNFLYKIKLSLNLKLTSLFKTIKSIILKKN